MPGLERPGKVPAPAAATRSADVGGPDSTGVWLRGGFWRVVAHPGTWIVLADRKVSIFRLAEFPEASWGGPPKRLRPTGEGLAIEFGWLSFVDEVEDAITHCTSHANFLFNAT